MEPDIAYRKLKSLIEGAEVASRRPWGRGQAPGRAPLHGGSAVADYTNPLKARLVPNVTALIQPRAWIDFTQRKVPVSFGQRQAVIFLETEGVAIRK